MHALMRSIILRVTRPASFQVDAQSHPPGRQPAQPKERVHAGKGRAVVTADSLRQTVSLKKPLEIGAHRLASGISKRTHFQHIAAVLIAYR
jgi:hypothetical protein